MLTPLGQRIQWGVLQRTLLGGQYIEEWVYSPHDFDTGVFTTDLATLRESNPARDLTAIGGVLVVFGTPRIGATGGRYVQRNDRVRITRNAEVLDMLIVAVENAPGDLASRYILEFV